MNWRGMDYLQTIVWIIMDYCDYCDTIVMLSSLNIYSDGTHSQQSIH